MTSRVPKPRVLIVEDEAPTRSTLTSTLEAEGYEVRPEADGCSVRAVAGEFRPDLAILDVRQRVGPDGYDIAKQLRQTGDLPVVVLIDNGGYDARKAGFDAGADDYLVKPVPREELVWRLRALLRRCPRLCSPLREIGDLTVDEGARAAVRAGRALELTATEHRLLSVLARHAGQVVSKDQLLALAWDGEEHAANLVEVHVSALRRKLEQHGSRLIHTVRGAGYVLYP